MHKTTVGTSETVVLTWLLSLCLRMWLYAAEAFTMLSLDVLCHDSCTCEHFFVMMACSWWGTSCTMLGILSISEERDS